jgi:hypothetical protein
MGTDQGALEMGRVYGGNEGMIDVSDILKRR